MTAPDASRDLPFELARLAHEAGPGRRALAGLVQLFAVASDGSAAVYLRGEKGFRREASAGRPELPEAAQEEISFLRRRKGHGWSELPAHLPREEVPIDMPKAERLCPCCNEPMQRIDEDRTKRNVVGAFLPPARASTIWCIVGTAL